MLGVWRLQLLREVARRGSVRAAAEALSITASAVSQQLRILESEAGAKLLEPQGRGVRLTEVGARLVEHADTILAAIEAAESDLAAAREEVSGTLRVAAFPTAARAILPAVIADLGRAHPALRVTLRDLETDESLAAVRRDEVDLAVVDEYPEARIRETGIDLEPLLEDPLVLAVPPGMAGLEAPVAIADLADASWIMDTEASTIYRAVVRHCRSAGFEPRVRSNCRDYSVIIALVEAGLGVALLPGLALRDRETRARLVPIEPPLRRRVLVASKPERRARPAVAAMVAALRERPGS